MNEQLEGQLLNARKVVTPASADIPTLTLTMSTNQLYNKMHARQPEIESNSDLFMIELGQVLRINFSESQISQLADSGFTPEQLRDIGVSDGHLTTPTYAFRYHLVDASPGTSESAPVDKIAVFQPYTRADKTLFRGHFFVKVDGEWRSQSSNHDYGPSEFVGTLLNPNTFGAQPLTMRH